MIDEAGVNAAIAIGRKAMSDEYKTDDVPAFVHILYTIYFKCSIMNAGSNDYEDDKCR